MVGPLVPPLRGNERPSRLRGEEGLQPRTPCRKSIREPGERGDLCVDTARQEPHRVEDENDETNLERFIADGTPR